MKLLPLSASRPPLIRLQESHSVLAFDFDGVLAPLVSKPSMTRVSPRTRHLLEKLTQAAPCVVVSGRALADLRRLLVDLRFTELVGNHGAERAGRLVPGAAALAVRARQWRRALLPLAVAGIELEDKRFSLSLHFRRARRPAVARATILDACSRLAGARIVPGRLVVNVVGSTAPNKGEALRAICHERRAQRALFVGDDQTDEDVFGLGWKGLVSVRVGRSRASRASFYLPRQRQVDDLLEALIELRATPRP
jgi:trehalose 6-phosphate phosphatase